MTSQNTYADVVVVGAGMAGLYFSWRMLGFGGQTVINLEKLNRTGGRLDTDMVQINGEPVKNEEGGMRFDVGMKNLMWLLQKLGRSAAIIPFGMGDDNNIYHLRGRRFTFGEAKNAALWSRLYKLAPNEQNKQPNLILQEVFESILTQNGINPKTSYPQTPEDWQKIRLECLYRGIPLYQWGFWALLTDYGLSQECMQMIEDCMGFLAFYRQEVNAGVGFQTMGDFDKLPDYQTLKPGYESLADTLTNQIINQMGGQILLGHMVDTITVNNDGTFTVMALASPDPIYINCKSLVLALPSLPLQKLAQSMPELRDNRQFMQDVQTVTSMPLTKINLYFTERWWFNRYQIANGGSFTDMPMAQFYCYDPISGDNTGPASMTIYCDYDRVGYWDTLQRIGTAFPPSDGLSQPANTTAASSFVIEHAMKQLSTFFNDQNLPQPVLSTYVGWGSSDAGDGDHSWTVGANDIEVMRRIANPVPNLYVCGEAYSDEQAWVDGALRSTETLLQNHFGLPPYGQGS